MAEVLVDSRGVVGEGLETQLALCKHCYSSLLRQRVPDFALSNHLFMGEVPPELKDLTVVEESMISLCRAKCCIVRLKADGQEYASRSAQRALKGNLIIYPQRPSEIAKKLPPSIEEITSPICVVFIGAHPPTKEWLRDKAKPLAVRAQKVRRALLWLKSHNTLYKDIVIDEAVLNHLDTNPALPFHVEHLVSSHATDVSTSGYDPSCSSTGSDPAPLTDPSSSSTGSDSAPLTDSADTGDIPFSSVVITDVENGVSSSQLAAAAIRHLRKKGGAYLNIPHDPTPANEFFNADLFPMIYPTLFPYGIGGFEDKNRRVKISMRRHVKHLFSLHDRRFQQHYSFLFTAFNVLQRREMLLRVGLKAKRRNFESVASRFAKLDDFAIHAISEKIASGNNVSACNEQERQVLDLMQHVNAVSSHIQGSAASKIKQRSELKALMIDQGLPSFYLTINPSDVHNPLVRFLAGSEINVDTVLPSDYDNYTQSMLVSANPFATAKFFNLYINAFIKALLAYEPNLFKRENGILRKVKAYYGCVEAQGRGTLHCHMLIWVEGGLNPDQIKQRVLDNDKEFMERLIDFLNDTISNCVPPDVDLDLPTYHPCSVRLPPVPPNSDIADSYIQRDRHLLALKCQYHRHSATCYKYDIHSCRFDMHEDNFRPISFFDPVTGELTLRCLDGLVNNFNTTILDSIRCNMDIKFVGSGASAKAILYYITDYITKSQLKTHVAYAALELAVARLGEYDPTADDLTFWAKRMLQRCAYAMLSHQELSAPQVISYLMDYDDHFTSHKYVSFNWSSAEAYVNKFVPLCENRSSTRSPIDSSHRNDAASSTDSDDNDTDSEADSDSDSSPADLSVPTTECDPDDEDVVLHMDSSNNLATSSSQLENYLCRTDELKDVCFWDYLSRVEKVSKAADRKKHRRQRSSVEDGDNSDGDSDLGNSDDPADLVQNGSDSEGDCSEHEDEFGAANEPRLWDLHVHRNKHLKSTKRKRPRIEFSSWHPESSTHYQRIRTRNNRLVPVPLGHSLPRRDRNESAERHAHLMLILLKPWSDVSSLKPVNTSWMEAYQSFTASCDARILQLINNMQILHECKDSRDDHFAKRSSERRSEARRAERDTVNARGGREIVNGLDETDVLAHLKDIDESWSEKISRSTETVNDCLKHARTSGLICDDVPADGVQPNMTTLACHQLRVDDTMERVWEHEYSERRKLWRSAGDHRQPNEHSSLPVGAQPILSSFQSQSMTTDAAEAIDQIWLTPHDESSIASVTIQRESDTPSTSVNVAVDPAVIAQTWNLNAKQKVAFHLIIDQSLRTNADPLHLIITGAAGTGKSRIIHAAQDFLSQKNQLYRFRLASFTGIAARNIHGQTLHSALALSALKGDQMPVKTRQSLVQMWANIDFLFIDEYSMIGCRMLYKIHLALTIAKECSLPFGGINIIFAGDFCQLPAVGETRLYAKFGSTKHASPEKSNLQSIYGKLLWISIKHVIILETVERQRGSGAQELISLLSRLREGRCSTDDFDFLNSRLASRLSSKENIGKWHNAPIIVSENATKDALNIAATQAFARQTGQNLYWYYCTDRHSGDIVNDEGLKQHLLALTSNNTNNRLGRIPLVIGMPVMLMTNFDVLHGIVNGTIGKLKSLQYYVDSDGLRHATSCTIESEHIVGEPLPGLDRNHGVALQDETEMMFIHPYSKKKCKIKRTQLPIQPAFSVTAHKSQGLSLDNVVVDLQSCSGSESPYVMISRVKSLDGLMVLRPFHRSKISCNLQQDVRDELKRQRILELATLARYGIGPLAGTAAQELADLGLDEVLNSEESTLDLQSCNLSTVIQRQHIIAHQLTTFSSSTDLTARSKRHRTESNTGECMYVTVRPNLIFRR